MSSMSSLFDEFYLETDEEVTQAIEKIKKSKKNTIALVLPRNAVLGQSIVNLKLIYRQALEMDKTVVIVSPDRVARNLADRVGFTVAESVDSIDPKDIEPVVAKAKPTPKGKEEEPQAAEISRQRFDQKPSESSTKTAEVAEATGLDEVSPQADDEMLEPVSESNDDTDGMDEEDVRTAPPIEDAEPMGAKATRMASSISGGMIPTRGNLRMYRNQKRRPMLLIAGGLILIGLIVLVVAGVVFPSANVKLTVKAQPFNDKVNTTVSVDQTSIDTNNGVLPGKLVTLTQETKVSAQATGKKDQGTKATGTVTISNAWDSNVHTFPAGTTIVAKNGNQYVLKNDVSVPGATSTISGGASTIIPGQKDGAVEAAQPGDSYNIAATTFTVPSLPKVQQDKITATSAAAMTGGSSKMVTVVTQSDIDGVSATAKKQNQSDALAKIKSDNADQVVIDKALQVVTQDASSSAKPDDVADSVEVKITGKFQIITFKSDDQKQLVEKLLVNKIPQGQTLVTQGTGVAVDTSQYDVNLVTDKKLELVNNIHAFTINGFDQGAIQRALVGAKSGTVVALASNTVPVTDASVTIHPSWWPRLPFWSQKIKIDLTYTSATP